MKYILAKHRIELNLLLLRRRLLWSSVKDLGVKELAAEDVTAKEKALMEP